MKVKISPTPKQHEAWKKLLDNETKFLIFGGGAGGGKSWLGCEWLIYMCYRYPGTKYFIAREELKRLMASTFVTFIKVCKHHNIPRTDWVLNGAYNYIQWKSGSRIDLLDVKKLPSDPLYERFGSTEYTSGWFEEAGEIDFGAVDVLKSRIGRHLNKEYGIMSKMLFTCNPKKNWLYYDVYKPWKEKTLNKIYCFIQSLYGDNPHTQKEYGENLRNIKDKSTRERLMFGNWEYDNDPAKIFEYDKILDIFTNSPLEEKGHRYLSVDVARSGEDKTVFIVWEGLHMKKIVYKEKQKTDKTQDMIEAFCKIQQIPRSNVIIDEDGIGGGVVDNVKGSKGFVNNSTAIQPKGKTKQYKPITWNFKNLKAQCWFKLAEYVNDGKISCDELDLVVKEKLIEDLEQIKQKDPDKDNKISVLSKEEIKKDLGRSTDFGDAMMMRMYFELKPKMIIY